MTATEAKATLAEVLAFLDEIPPPVAPENVDAGVQHQAHAFSLAVMADEEMPISLLRPWASYESFRKWEKAEKITLTRRNGKVCVRPSVFFAFWKTLPDETKPAA